MRDKCAGCIFAYEEEYMTAIIPICTREEDYIESVNARTDTEPCPFYISKKKIIDLQNDGMLVCVKGE